MPDPVKRSYDSSGRRARALEVRRAVVSAARALFEEHGFAATTVVLVARRAGVSPESVYKTFGTKATLAKAALDTALAGDDEPVAVANRPDADAIRAEPDLDEKLRLFARGAAERNERSAPMQLAIRDAASLDPVLAQVWRNVLDERLAGMTALAGHLAETDGLRAGVDVQIARDVLWSLISVEVYQLFVMHRGWTRDQYADWLARALLAHLA